jgi:hypothetical protein
MPDAEERMLLDDKNEDPTERNSRCTEEVTNAELFSLLEICENSVYVYMYYYAQNT